MTNEQIVRDACRVIWTEGDLSRVEEFYGDGFKADYSLTDWGVGVEGVRALASGIRVGFPDYAEQIEALFDAGDNIIVKLAITGTHKGTFAGIAATGKEFSFRDVSICQVADGKIIAQSGVSDQLSLFLQLGLIDLPGGSK